MRNWGESLINKEMKRKITSLITLSLFSTILFAGGNPRDSRTDNNGEEITYVKNNKRQPNLKLQQHFRQKNSWKNFTSQYGNWYSVFNETNGMPSRAFGKAISISGSSDKNKALNFAINNLKEFNLPVEDLVFQGSHSSSKHKFVNFYQTHEGLKVLESEYTVRLNLAGDKVLLFGANVYNNINVSTIPSIPSTNIGAYAMENLTGTIEDVIVKDELFILPIQSSEIKNTFKLVYEVNVNTRNENLPSEFYTLVDANTGEILYRQDMVWYCGESCTHNHTEEERAVKESVVIDGDVQINGTVYITDPQSPSTVVGLPNINFTAGSGSYTTDGNGFVSSGEAAGANLNIPLSGLYSTVYNNGSTTSPTVSTTLNSGTHTIDFNGDANINELSAYYGVNIIHDYMKSVLPSFTGMDFSLTTNIDVTPQECNAFYSGASGGSINFYLDAADCYSYAKVSDVIYHEYGHGINDKFYQSQSVTFKNRAMGEGYADVWAFAPNEDPILGDGSDPADLASYIRIYSEDPKVYPEDIIGEEHADGEIIAGAWWDLYVNLGSNTIAMDATMQLFADAYPGLQAATANGNEGTAFTKVLIDVLLADDNDGDISNGTPNSIAIIDAFDKHGISLISNAELAHTQLIKEDENVDIAITAELNFTTDLNIPGQLGYVDNVNCSYMINNTDVWTEIQLTNTSGNTYDGIIPAQPKGTIISYYLNAVDINGKIASTQPIASNLVGQNANLPHQIMIGYVSKAIEDGGDFYDFGDLFGSWTVGSSTDGATTGVWQNNKPVGSFSDLNGDDNPDTNNPNAMVAPDHQNTIDGTYCWVTQRNSSKSAAIGERDVDGGKTTLTSPVMDLTDHSNPAISYFRWYVNNPPSGANPGADWFQVEITEDGVNWDYIENSKASDASWRRNAFRLKDYVSSYENVQIRFIVSDSTRLGQNLDGGSLVESAIDDIYIWDESEVDEIDFEDENTGVSVNEISNKTKLNIYPNPSNGEFTIELNTNQLSNIEIEVRNLVGQIIYKRTTENLKGKNKIQINEDLESGVYLISVNINDKIITEKITIE